MPAPPLPPADLDALIGLLTRGRIADAVRHGRALAARHPGHPLLLTVLAVALEQAGEVAAAEAAFRQALALAPDDPAANYNYANLLFAQRRLDEAAAAFERCLAQDPRHLQALNNLGALRQEQGEWAQAIAVFERALAIEPRFADVWNNLGNAHKQLGRLDAAQAAYARALAVDPGLADVWSNLGGVLLGLDRLDEAKAAIERALALDPDSAEAHFLLGSLYGEIDFHDQAIAAHERALALKPGFAAALAELVHRRALVCDWSRRDADVAAAAALTDAEEPVAPLPLMALADAPEHARRRAEAYVARNYRATPAILPVPAGPRLRIGYFSADWHEHPVMHLLRGTLAAHDRTRFEIVAFSWSARDDWARQRLVQAVDRFVDMRDVPPEQALARIRAEGLAIAVDLSGHTGNDHFGLFAQRVAPVQVTWLGYPGTTGAPFIDYLVADAVVAPPGSEPFYRERLLRLPHSFMPADNARPLVAPLSRRELGLPEQGFVFCAFNNGYKIGPAEFAIWMRLLSEVPGSVLWLHGIKPRGRENLAREAGAQGIDPARLVHATRLDYADHLARHAQADLFLDTFAYNAHSTMCDALWGGLPAVTMAGRGFPARVAASLLHAVGLPELVTGTPDAYAALALALAHDPARIAALRAQLAEGRLRLPLFDTADHVRRLEAGLVMAWQRARDGLPPADIAVPA